MIQTYEKVGEPILERVIFLKTFHNNTKVILVADAYRGDRMHECLNDYFNSLSGHFKDSILYNGKYIPINGSADLVAFNGHNGLMDETTKYAYATPSTQT